MAEPPRKLANASVRLLLAVRFGVWETLLLSVLRQFSSFRFYGSLRYKTV